MFSRRRFLGGVSLAGIGTFGYARCIEAERLQVRQRSVPIGRGGNAPIKLLHLSDLHASSVVPLSYISSAIDAGLTLRPDVICLTGDYITTTLDAPSDYAAILRKLSAAAPCFGVLGNHDGGAWARRNDGYENVDRVTGLLGNAGIRLLGNSSADIAIQGTPIRLVGLYDAWSGYFNAAKAFAGAAGGETKSGITVCLSHNPDTKDALSRYGWDLMLSGHTHGGQLSLPLIGTPFAPVKDMRYVLGLHRWRDRWLHITAGVGNVLGVRINCPPDVTLLTLV
jgi:predicted MPP superfamily phosphohydrolase